MTDEVQLDLHGVRLPSDDWVNIPGTWLQVRTQMTDPFGTIYLRRDPDDPDAPECPNCAPFVWQRR